MVANAIAVNEGAVRVIPTPRCGNEVHVSCHVISRLVTMSTISVVIEEMSHHQVFFRGNSA